MGTHAAQARWTGRNSRVSAWFSLAITAVAIGGVVALLAISNLAGLYIPPTIAQLGLGTFDGINVLFFFMWTSMLQLLSVNDGLRYRLQVGKRRVPRNRVSDLLTLTAFTVVAVLWGVVSTEVFAGRTTDPTYLDRLPAGVAASSLEHGVTAVTITYFALVALVLVLVLVARRFNPVNFAEFDRQVRVILHLPTAERAAQ